MANIEGNSYPFQYEWFASFEPRTYQIAASGLAAVNGGINDGDWVLEIGSGTGISTGVLLKSNPNLGKLVGLEPSMGNFGDVIKIAGYKLGISNLVIEGDNQKYPEGLAYIEEQRIKVLGYKNVDLIRATSHSLPFGRGVFDKAYCPESFHWLSFKTTNSAPDFSVLTASVDQIARVLKPNGQFFFESNGHIFSFGDERLKDGRKLDDAHTANHPLRQSFTVNLNRLLAEAKIPIPKEETDPLYHLFSLENIQKILAKSGFELLEQSGKPYSKVMLPFNAERTIQSIPVAARMTYFNSPQLNSLSEQEKDELVRKALERTLNEKNQQNQDQDYYETFIFFAAKKVG